MKAGILVLAAIVAVLAAGCRQEPHITQKEKPMPKLVFVTRDGCPNTPEMRANLDKALSDLGQPMTYEVIDAASLAKDDPTTAYGTPTILLNGKDLFDRPMPSKAAEPT